MCLQYLYAIMVKETSPMTTEFVINNRIYILHTISSFIFHLAILGVYFNGTLSSPCLHTHMSHTYTPTHTHTVTRTVVHKKRQARERRLSATTTTATSTLYLCKYFGGTNKTPERTLNSGVVCGHKARL